MEFLRGHMRHIAVLFSAMIFSCASYAGTVLPGPIQNSAQAVLDYWTSERMEEAHDSFVGFPPNNPEEKPITEGGDSRGYAPTRAPYADGRLSRLTGMLFFVEGSHLAHCSASVIDSASGSVILTAAHCLRHAGEDWHPQLMFVPGYNGSAATESERMPFGRWAIRQGFIPDADAGGTPARDVGVARLHRSVDLGDTVQARLGDALHAMSQRDALDTRIRTIGYPAYRVGYGFGQQFYCDSFAHTDLASGALRVPHCGLGEGHSGGPAIEDPDGQGDGLPGEVRKVIGVLNYIQFAQLNPDNFDELYRHADVHED